MPRKSKELVDMAEKVKNLTDMVASLRSDANKSNEINREIKKFGEEIESLSGKLRDLDEDIRDLSNGKVDKKSEDSVEDLPMHFVHPYLRNMMRDSLDNRPRKIRQLHEMYRIIRDTMNKDIVSTSEFGKFIHEHTTAKRTLDRIMEKLQIDRTNEDLACNAVTKRIDLLIMNEMV